jgi:hypothetical protein
MVCKVRVRKPVWFRVEKVRLRTYNLTFNPNRPLSLNPETKDHDFLVEVFWRLF